MSHYYFKKHLGTSWLEKKSPALVWNQLKLLSMALELMLSVLAHSDVSLANYFLLIISNVCLCASQWATLTLS